MKLLRNYIIVLSAVALIAVILSVLSVSGYLKQADQTVFSPKDPLTADQSEQATEGLTRLLKRAISNATLLPEAPTIPDATPCYTLQTRTAGGAFVGAYSLHVIRMIDRNALLQDLTTGSFYRISVQDFEALLSHAVFKGIARDGFAEPTVTVGSTTCNAASFGTVFLYTPQGTFEKETLPQEEASHTLEVSSLDAPPAPVAEASEEPDAWSLTVKRNGTNFLSQTKVTTQELFFPTEAGDYVYELTAHWNMNTTRDWYGDLTYALKIHVQDPPPSTDLSEDTEGKVSDS